MGLVRTADPSAFLSLGEAKAHLRVDADNTAEDDLITAYAAAAEDRIEGLLNRAILDQEWTLTIDEFPRGCYGRVNPRTWPASERGPSSSLAPDLRIWLPRPSLRSITSIKYVNTSGVQTTLDPTAYVADTTGLPGSVRPAYGTSWPATQPVPNAVEIVFKAGFSDDPNLVPKTIKAACLLDLADLYTRREPGAAVDDTICNLLARHVYREVA